MAREKDKKIVKHSAWCIVIDKENKKVILTIKVTNKTEAELIKNMLLSADDTIKMFSFTKGKIEEWHTREETALRETQEESGIDAQDITIQKSLWYFSKEKRYGSKIVHMYVWTLNKAYTDFHPADPRHLACSIDREKVGKLLEKKEEKKFRNSDIVQNAINEIFNSTNDLLLTPWEKDELKVDAWVVR